MIYQEYIEKVKFYLEKFGYNSVLSSKEIIMLVEESANIERTDVMAFKIIRDRNYEEKTSVPQL
jgi:hypothetical protein